MRERVLKGDHLDLIIVWNALSTHWIWLQYLGRNGRQWDDLHIHQG